MGFLTELEQGTNRNTYTENGALTNDSTLDAALDFFSLAGAMRNNVPDAIRLFRAAYAEDPQLAARILFYLRDVRGGQGERDLFRKLYTEMYKLDPVTAHKLLGHIPTYGRWDDLVHIAPFVSLIELIKTQLHSDLENMEVSKPVSLMAKWLPSENASSVFSRKAARDIARGLCMSNREYRKVLVSLRSYISLLEQKMSANEWDQIEYGKIPSQAGRKHAKAFGRHDHERYSQFIADVLTGKQKMHAGTLFTYEVMDAMRNGDTETANALWASLPDYTNGDNALVIADVSGSMSGRPMDVSVSLALYFAEHNTGPFHNYFMTFSYSPELVKVRGNTLRERLNNISTANWDMNTNIEAAFMAILDAAKRADASAQDIPKVLYVISDMEFDYCTSGETNFENAKRMFEENDLSLPHVVFWNVNAHQIQAPATKYDKNVTLISGLSQNAFRYAVEGKNPVELMLDVVNSDRYSDIVV